MFDKLNTVDIDPKTQGGIPVLSGTRFRVSQLLSELADGMSISEIAYDLDLRERDIKDFLNELSIMIEKEYKNV